MILQKACRNPIRNQARSLFPSSQKGLGPTYQCFNPNRRLWQWSRQVYVVLVSHHLLIYGTADCSIVRENTPSLATTRPNPAYGLEDDHRFMHLSVVDTFQVTATFVSARHVFTSFRYSICNYKHGDLGPCTLFENLVVLKCKCRWLKVVWIATLMMVRSRMQQGARQGRETAQPNLWIHWDLWLFSSLYDISGSLCG